MIKLSIIIPVYNQEHLVFRALDSIPVREDIEVICIDDCSTDNTYALLREYANSSVNKFVLLHNEENKGVGYTTNKGYDIANGEWIIGIDNDDYLLTDDYNRFIDFLDTHADYDMIYLNNEVNDKSVWKDTTRSAIWSYAIRKDYLGDIRMLEDRNVLVDWKLKQKLDSLNPKIISSDITCYHYNYPREGSLLQTIRNKK